jgi:uncharacterized protein YcbK (DUF882 family)
MKGRLLACTLGAVACAITALPLSGFATKPVAAGDERAISLYNIHTKENLNIVFKRDGKFVAEALEKFNHFMRDWRANISTKMDPALLDLMWDIHRELRSQRPIYIISGHRSGSTNERMRRAGGGQARGSRHITGQAADIHFPDVDAKQLRNSALVREKGGVGYYPTSAIPFVHIDTGNVRHWPRLPRQELAILFPNGGSKHTPPDGRPITRQDFQLALARFQSSGAALPIVTQRLLNRHAAPRPGPILASLGPTGVNLSPEHKMDQVAALAPAPQIIAPPRAEAETPQTTVPTIGRAAPPIRRDVYAPGFVTAALPRNEQSLPDDQVARAPDYDDDHPDEENYNPFPILPLLTDTPLAYEDFSKEGRPIVRRVQILLSDADGSVNVHLERGPQYEGMYWAQRFTGKAVSGAITKFVATESTSSTVTKTAASAAMTAR